METLEKLIVPSLLVASFLPISSNYSNPDYQQSLLSTHAEILFQDNQKNNPSMEISEIVSSLKSENRNPILAETQYGSLSIFYDKPRQGDYNEHASYSCEVRLREKDTKLVGIKIYFDSQNQPMELSAYRFVTKKSGEKINEFGKEIILPSENDSFYFPTWDISESYHDLDSTGSVDQGDYYRSPNRIPKPSSKFKNIFIPRHPGDMTESERPFYQSQFNEIVAELKEVLKTVK